MLANEDVGFVIIGQKARIKIAAYPFTKYGLLERSLIHVGSDASDLKQNNSPQAAALTYRALVRLESQKLAGFNGTVALALNSGMAAVVEINQGKRSVMEYLLLLVMKVRAEAGRER